MTEQEIFDKVVAHARTQKARCSNETNSCFYRGENGAKCFLGALIPDEKYDKLLEGLPGSNILVLQALGLDCTMVDFICRLQRIHDYNPLPGWECSFKEIAQDFGLTYTAP